MKYDYTLKDLFKDIPSALLELLTGFRDGKFLDIQFPEIKYRQPDLLLELPDSTIFHLELQSCYDSSMLLRMLEYHLLLESDKPEDVVLAILCKTDEPERTVRRILEKLSVLPEKTRRDYILKLLNLSHLRKLDFLVQEEVKKMPITIDMEESLLLKQGQTKGKQEAKKTDVLNLYTKLNLKPEKIAEVLDVEAAFVISTLKEAGFLKHS